jgi:GAF domain-containing protein
MIDRPYFRSKTKSDADETRKPPDIYELRRQILRSILIGSSLMAVIAIIPGIAQRIELGEYLMAGVLGFAFISVIVLTIFAKIPYRIRALGFLLVVAILGLSTMISDGIYGNSRIFLIALPVLASLLLGGSAGFIGAAVSLGIVILFAVLMLDGRIPLPLFGPGEGHASLTYWLVAITSFAMVSMAMILPLYSLVNGLIRSLSHTNQLADALDLERSQLEHRVIERTQEVERRLVQLRTAADISRSISVSFSRDLYSRGAATASSQQAGSEAQDVETLLQEVVDLVRERFNLYYAGVFLLSEDQRTALLHAGTGEPGKLMLAQHHHLPVDDNSMVGWAIHHRQARIALDVSPGSPPSSILERRKEGPITITRFKNPLLPKTRSELALPMLRGDTPIGAMTVQSEIPRAFDQDDIMVLQSIADTLTAALDNARLFQQTQQNLHEIRALNRLYFVESWKSSKDWPEFNRVEYVNVEKLTDAAELPIPSTSSANSESDVARLESISVPLSLREQTIGSLTVERDTPLTDEEQSLVESIAMETSLALENVRLLKEAQRRASQERMISNLSRQVSSTTDIDSIMKVTVSELAQALNATAAVIHLGIADPEAEVLGRTSAKPLEPEDVIEGQLP